MNQCLVSEHLQDVETPPPALTGKADLVSGSILAHSAASSPYPQTLCPTSRQPMDEVGREVL